MEAVCYIYIRNILTPDLSGGFVLVQKAGPPEGAQNFIAEMPVQMLSPGPRGFP